ncbi:MAG: winged helix-turn-helix domain-containing protein [Pyrinomonadaceae bacterium]|nr:winged helix-turn-helix domain-containing protein [Pyrinomonadaceae bacterium]
MGAAPKISYIFGDFRLDADERVLRRGDAIVPLPAKVLDVLCLLVGKSGSVVSKSEILDTVWPDSFVEESNLTQSIYALRRALGSDQEGRAFIETIPKRGYRFASAVQTTSERRATALTVQPPLDATNNRQIGGFRKMAILALAAIFVFGLATFLTARYLTPMPAAPVENVKFQRLTFAGDISFPVLSPDGKSIAYVKDAAIYLQDVATGSSVKLEIPDIKTIGNLQFSVEGDSIFFRNENSFDASGDLYQVSRFGGQAKRVAERIWSTVGFSPDGRQFAFVRLYPDTGEWALLIRSLENGSEQKILGRNQPFSIYRSGYPAWSPDSKHIAVVEQSPDQVNASSIVIVDVDTRTAEKLKTQRFIQIEQLAWSPDSERLLISGRENNRFFQLWSMELKSGEIRPITNDLNIYRNISISSDGKRLLARQFSTYSHIWVADAAEIQKLRQVTFGNLSRDGSAGITWAPDGLVVYSSRIMGDIDIWSLAPGTGVRKQLTANSGTNNENPFVTADGRYVFFESTRSGTRTIWRSDTDGSNPIQITFADGGTDFLPVVSPDGANLYYIQRNPKSNILWRQSLAGGTREMLTQPGKMYPASFLSMSTDGRYLAFENIRSDNRQPGTEIVIFDLTVSSVARTIKIDSANEKIVFTDSGTSIDYCENNKAGAKFWRIPLDGNGEKKLLFELPKERIFGFAWSSDFRTLAIARGKQDTDAILLTGF